MIAGLGEKGDFVASVPNLDPSQLNLNAEERQLFDRIGRATQISVLIANSGLSEAKTIALLLSLRAKGAVVPARVQRATSKSGSFPAAGMHEQVDLSEERKREILELEVALETKNYFELMGVPVGSSPQQVKEAFYELSRKFHPDRFFQRNIGSFRARIELVYRRLSHAHETLCDDDRRAAYLRANPHLNVERPPAPTSAPAPAPAPAKPKPRTAEDDARDAERKSRFARHPYFAKGARINELLGRAKSHMAQGDYGHAFTDLHMAHQIDDKNAEVQKLLVEVRAHNDMVRSKEELKRGMDLLEQGNENAALAAFKTALNVDAKNGRAAFMVAKMMWDKGADAKEVLGFAQRAVDADPKNADFHALLGRLHDSSGMKAMAKKHFEEALRLDPKHPEAKKHVKGRWPF